MSQSLLVAVPRNPNSDRTNMYKYSELTFATVYIKLIPSGGGIEGICRRSSPLLPPHSLKKLVSVYRTTSPLLLPKCVQHPMVNDPLHPSSPLAPPRCVHCGMTWEYTFGIPLLGLHFWVRRIGLLHFPFHFPCPDTRSHSENDGIQEYHCSYLGKVDKMNAEYPKPCGCT